MCCYICRRFLYLMRSPESFKLAFALDLDVLSNEENAYRRHLVPYRRAPRLLLQCSENLPDKCLGEVRKLADHFVAVEELSLKILPAKVYDNLPNFSHVRKIKAELNVMKNFADYLIRNCRAESNDPMVSNTSLMKVEKLELAFEGTSNDLYQGLATINHQIPCLQEIRFVQSGFEEHGMVGLLAPEEIQEFEEGKTNKSVPAHIVNTVQSVIFAHCYMRKLFLRSPSPCLLLHERLEVLVMWRCGRYPDNLGPFGALLPKFLHLRELILDNDAFALLQPLLIDLNTNRWHSSAMKKVKLAIDDVKMKQTRNEKRVFDVLFDNALDFVHLEFSIEVQDIWKWLDLEQRAKHTLINNLPKQFVIEVNDNQWQGIPKLLKYFAREFNAQSSTTDPSSSAVLKFDTDECVVFKLAFFAGSYTTKGVRLKFLDDFTRITVDLQPYLVLFKNQSCDKNLQEQRCTTHLLKEISSEKPYDSSPTWEYAHPSVDASDPYPDPNEGEEEDEN
ncbi:hypothetical protein RFI_04175 [Reticulomyxa filosa]|uniref:Uncharacterized protein n=1 Tax=Reticulomyxa filosa TaxID=46433 RepID=X6P415_RETFI|nr:hypothetical protein RFI_04175 [Reticulomyxa filosa]|eukprot:ETO32931.1 hypothetical protein RFI_04175 [Reticulomyxa filosa]